MNNTRGTGREKEANFHDCVRRKASREMILTTKERQMFRHTIDE